jgi:hypothetical protein
MLSSFYSSVKILVSFGGQPGSLNGAFVSSRSEPISLSTLDRDCFIIPVRSLDRFLPAGVPVSFVIYQLEISLKLFFYSFQQLRPNPKTQLTRPARYQCWKYPIQKFVSLPT